MTAPIHLKAKDDSLELLLYGEIGFGPLSAAAVAKVLDANKSAPVIRVRINSPGGDAFDGIAIHNLLAKHSARVEVDIDGQASSAASLVAMAGDVVRIASNSLMMIHEAHGGAGGTAAQLAADAAALVKLNEGAARMYAARTGKTPEAIASLMSTDSWLTAEEAVELGLADEVTDPKQIAASVAKFLSPRSADDEEPKSMDEEPKAMPEEEPKAEEGVEPEANADEEPAMEAEDVDGNGVVEAIAKATGLDKAAAIALLTDKLDAVAQMLNEAIEADGSASDQPQTTEVVEPEALAGGASLIARMQARKIEKLEATIAKFKADDASRAEKALDAEVDGLIREGFLLDSERGEARKLLKADPESARKLFSTKKVPVPQAGDEGAAQTATPKIGDLTDNQRLLVASLKAAGFRGGDETACVKHVLGQQSQETN